MVQALHEGICRRAISALLLLAVSAIAHGQDDRSQSSVQSAFGEELQLGGFDRMFERRLVRVLVPHSRTLFFNDRGRERGLSAENVRDFELYLNQKYRREAKRRPITVQIIPTPRERLISGIVDGFGDLAVGNLTVTPERERLVDFVAPPVLAGVSELVITSDREPPLTDLAAMSGRTVYVRTSSSYFESLHTLNALLEQWQLEVVTIRAVSEHLEDEDLMEMVDAGILSTIVVDDWKARMWAPILPHLVVNEGVAVRTDAKVGWALRKDSPKLQQELQDFFLSFERKRGSIEYRFAQYSKQMKRLQNPTTRQDWKRFEETMHLFEKYGERYGVDPLLLVAQGYQESRLDQSVRSPVGAIGVMQLMPDTGLEMDVGDVSQLEPNIHAGVKYMRQIMDRHFDDAEMDDRERMLFACASYNAGPSRIKRLRAEAAFRGLDPNRWFDNVEIVVSERIGRETTTYVRNILKYHISYQLTLEMEEAVERAREELHGVGR